MAQIDGYEDYLESFKKRAAREADVVLKAREEAREAADDAARVILERFRPEKLILIGSLPRGVFKPGSDIDFAVAGLTGDQAYQASVLASDLTNSRVDVVRLEAMTPGWRGHHERFGEMIYGSH